jgi:tetratricopeptide (TPR) repeat protein
MRRLWVTVAVTLIAAAGAWGAPTPNSPREILEQAYREHSAGNLRAAVDAYERFLMLFPDAADVRSNLGAALVGLGEVRRAIEEYRMALEEGSGSDPDGIRFNLALALFKAAQWHEASLELRKLLDSQPDNWRASLLLGDCLMRADRFDEVVELLAPFEGELGANRLWLYLYGTSLIRGGEAAKGERIVDRLLRQGESAEAHIMLGTAYLMVRDIPGAVAEFQKALEINPELPSANRLTAMALQDMSRPEEAVLHFRRELEVNPHDFEALLHLGVHLYKTEQGYDEALALFDRALRVRPGALEVRFQIGLVYVLQERVDEALRIIERVVEEAPDFLEGHVTLTRLYYRLRRQEDAERHRRIVEELRAERDAETHKGADGVDETSGDDA